MPHRLCCEGCVRLVEIEQGNLIKRKLRKSNLACTQPWNLTNHRYERKRQVGYSIIDYLKFKKQGIECEDGEVNDDDDDDDDDD